MELSLAYDSTKPWGDMLYEEQQNRKLALLRMPEPEWLECVNAYFTSLRGNGRGLVSALAWANGIATERAEFQSPKPKAMAMTEAERNWRVWRDMVEEPEKYGSDIAEWFALDEEVRSGPKRWRVDAFWYGKVREVEELEAAAATKIQALWNGYVARTLLAHRFTCARCLCHGVCTVPWTEPDSYICTACNVEWTTMLKVLGHELEQEEEDSRQAMEEYEARLVEDAIHAGEEEICAECDEDILLYGAKVGDSWFCPSCIHDWEECDSCEKPRRLGTECDNHCLWCRDSLTGLRGTGGYCGRECATDAMREDEKTNRNC
jgi:hypothetical protein